MGSVSPVAWLMVSYSDYASRSGSGSSRMDLVEKSTWVRLRKPNAAVSGSTPLDTISIAEGSITK